MSQARVSFELTSRCNLNCQHCLRDKSRDKDLDPALVKRVLEEVKTYGINFLSFTGGEPLIHPDFEEVIRYSVEQGFEISLVTNGLCLQEFSGLFSDKSIKEKISLICVSLESTDKDTNDHIRGKGSFERALKGILYLKAEQIPFALKFTINSLNYQKLEGMVMFAGRLGAREVQFAHLHPTPENLKAGLVLKPRLWYRVQKEISQVQSLVRIPIKLSAGGWMEDLFPICAHLAMTEFYVDSEGWLSVCCILPSLAGAEPGKERVANLNQTSFISAHRRLIEVLKDFFLKRLERIEKNQTRELDHFQCLACALYFDKLNWLKEFPDSEWYQLWQKALGK